jgi:hypothetical protein
MGDATPVYLFQEWVQTPVFHVSNRNIADERVELDDGWVRITKTWRTACGRVVSEWAWDEHPDRARPWNERVRNQRDGASPPTHLRRDHAEAFARLCARCFASGASWSAQAVVDLDDLRLVLAELGRTAEPSRAAIAAADRLRETLAPTLFDAPLSDPAADTVGAHHAHGGDTERRAAWEVMPASGSQRLRVLEAIDNAGSEGRTDQELEDELDIQRPSAGNRRGELMTGGWVRDSGRRRPTRSGKDAVVWVLTDAGAARLTNRRETQRG